MAIGTYDQLVSAVAAWLMRDDLTAVIPDFVALAEAQMARQLRLRVMMKRTTTTLDEAYELLPTDFLQMWRLKLDDEPLRYCPPELLTTYAEQYRGYPPQYYSIIGENLQVAPGPLSGGTNSLELVYYARPPALSADNPTNRILTLHPDLYLYGALLQSAPYLGDDPRIQVWGALYGASLEAERAADGDAAIGAGPLVIQGAGAWD